MNPSYPILEFDATRRAMIEPAQVIVAGDAPQHCVICFFKEVIDKVSSQPQTKVAFANHWEDGPHPFYEIAHAGQRIGFFHPGIGAPLAAGLLEEAIAFGFRKFIACGGCGVLDKDIAVGNLMVVSAAVRDEGTSYHYLSPGREIATHPEGIAALETTLSGRGIPYREVKTWTTDAPFRETHARIQSRREEGCAVVEMEAAGMMAVAAFRGVVFGQVLYGGDDLSGVEWDNRGWQSRSEVRERLFWLAAEACLRL